MSTQLELAKNRLFEKGGLHADNVKLFPGSIREASRERVAEQVNRSLSQIEAGDYEVVGDEADDDKPC